MKKVLFCIAIVLLVYGFCKLSGYINNKVYEDCLSTGEHTQETCYDVAYQH